MIWNYVLSSSLILGAPENIREPRNLVATFHMCIVIPQFLFLLFYFLFPKTARLWSILPFWCLHHLSSSQLALLSVLLKAKARPFKRLLLSPQIFFKNLCGDPNISGGTKIIWSLIYICVVTFLSFSFFFPKPLVWHVPSGAIFLNSSFFIYHSSFIKNR